MRLTLRTLLSWKDGMLDPEAARDLAARVEASAAARRLLDRIDEVTTRPTLSSPAADATGFPTGVNATAEYLDNVLPSDQLGEFERICYASDAQLAETAATHAILAETSREPAAALDVATRRRLLKAVKARATPGVADAAPFALPSVQPDRPPPGKAPSRAPASAWLLVAAALLLLIVLGGVLGWSLGQGIGKPPARRDVAAHADHAAEPAPEERAEVAAPATPDAAGPALADSSPADLGFETAPGPSPAGAAAAPPAGEPAARGTDRPAPDRSADDVPPFARDEEDEEMETAAGDEDGATTVASVVEPTEPAPVAQRVPQGDALAIAAPAATIPPRPAPAAARPQAAAAPRPAAAALVVERGVLLHRPPGGGADEWLAAAEGQPLELPVDLVALPFVGPTLRVEGTTIALEPGTRAVLARDADGTPRVEVAFGAAAVAGEGRIGVSAGGLVGVATAGLAAPVGVEVTLDRPPGAAAEATRRVARIVPTTVPLSWRRMAAEDGDRGAPAGARGDVADVPVGRALVWRSGGPDTVAVEAAGPLPPWLAGRRTDDPVDSLAARALAVRLAAGTAALPALRELAADRRNECRMAAAAALALVGEFAELARLVSADGRERLRDGEWARLDAVAVQPALARGPRAADALARALSEYGPPGVAEAVMRLARGFSAEELAAGGAAELVAALESPHLVVRRYAIKNLVEITAADGIDRQRYRADRPAEALREGAAWWRARLAQGRIRRGDVAAGADR